MDRERYTPGDGLLHPETGLTEWFQDANGAVFKETRHDAHGNRFTHNYALDPAERYGYSYAGNGSHRHHRHAAPIPAAASGTYSSPTNFTNSDTVTSASTVTGDFYSPSLSDADIEAAGQGLLWIALLVVAFIALPVCVAIQVYRVGARSGRVAESAIVALVLAEPAWLLLLWSWWGHLAWWSVAIALILPAGYVVRAFVMARRSAATRTEALRWPGL